MVKQTNQGFWFQTHHKKENSKDYCKNGSRPTEFSKEMAVFPVKEVGDLAYASKRHENTAHVTK